MPHQLLQKENDRKIQRPHWNELSRELLLGACVLKKMRGRAENQELVLGGFQNAGWPEQLPIAQLLEQNPSLRRRSLAEAIAGINRGQSVPGVQLVLSQDGSMICWHVSEPEPPEFMRIDRPDGNIPEPEISEGSPGTFGEAREAIRPISGIDCAIR